MTNDQRCHVGIGAILACFTSAILMAIFREPRYAIGIVGEGFCWVVFTLYFAWRAVEEAKPGVQRVRYFSIAEEFTRFPEGRTLRDSVRSGEALREILIPILKDEKALVLNMNGTMGYASSWLEGCFFDLEAHAPIGRLVIVCDDPSIEQECWNYIQTHTAARERQRRLSNEEVERLFPERRP